MWKVIRNGRYIGVKESNYPWASAYWRRQCAVGVRYTLVWEEK